MGKEILDLSTIVEHPTVNIASKRHPKGKLYELINLADLGPFEYATVLQRHAESRALAEKPKLTAAERRQLEKARADTVKLLVPKLEPTVLAELTPQQQDMLVLAWSAHVQAQGSAEGNARSRRTTDGSSRDSRPSTAGRPKAGSTPRTGR